jgi:hypothetical protein
VSREVEGHRLYDRGPRIDPNQDVDALTHGPTPRQAHTATASRAGRFLPPSFPPASPRPDPASGVIVDFKPGIGSTSALSRASPRFPLPFPSKLTRCVLFWCVHFFADREFYFTYGRTCQRWRTATRTGGKPMLTEWDQRLGYRPHGPPQGGSRGGTGPLPGAGTAAGTSLGRTSHAPPAEQSGHDAVRLTAAGLRIEPRAPRTRLDAGPGTTGGAAPAPVTFGRVV